MKSTASFLATGCYLSLTVSTRAWHLPDAKPAVFWSPQHQQQPLGAISNPTGAAADDDIDIITGSQFNGLKTFANLPYVNALVDEEAEADGNSYDIAILGAPFDTATSGRPGARFGPSGIRTGSQRIFPGVISVYTGEGTLNRWAKVVDVGDVGLTWFDNSVALRQLDKAHRVISSRPAANSSVSKTPRILTLGGDHTTTLSALRSTAERWGDVSVIHFDSHIDTWDPTVLGGGLSDYAGINHGTFLHIAHEEGLIKNTSIHAGIRAPVMRPKDDIRNDVRCGFELITARAIDRIGAEGVVKQIKERVGSSNVYITVDIDVLDPAYAPATGTAEPGGWTSRELLTILDGLSGLKVIGGDVVEVAPIYDNPGETTVLAAAEVALSLLRLMVEVPVSSKADSK
ncbi:arginase family-domain-containing protein [Coniella lustricola]|uniref:Arginase family-domain-containing protein n=1 Tax=Coniella lustricola TaxID=2025994 RepID=A0A2T3AFD7_9PEZI|nr:arginase family-domain-containing protein [Coniella lustricola]